MSNFNQGYQSSDYQGSKYPSAPSEPFPDYPAPTYDQATTPIVQIQQPNYQAIPLIQTQVILVGGCPACRLVTLKLINSFYHKLVFFIFIELEY